MNVQFLLFVIAVLLFAIFWELCKINSRLKLLSTKAEAESRISTVATLKGSGETTV